MDQEKTISPGLRRDRMSEPFWFVGSLSTLVHKFSDVFSRMVETLHLASGIQSDNWCHSEPCGSVAKNLRSPQFVAVFMKTDT